MAPRKDSVKTNINFSYEEAVKAIKSIKGSQSIIGNEIADICTIRKIKTGIPTLDYLCSGGISEGRITIFGGKPSSAKSTITLQGVVAPLIQEIKNNNEMKFGLIIDAEGGYDSPYAKTLGVDEKYLIIKRKKVIEDAFQEADDLISAGFIKFMIIDSLDSMVSTKGSENAYNATMGGTAGALSQHLPILYDKIMEHNVTTVIIKQARTKLGGFNPTGQELIQISGGWALKHLADSTIILNRLSNRNLNYTPIQVKGEKTRSSRMGLVMDVPLSNNGIDVIRDAVNLSIAHGMIVTGGAGWMTYEGVKVQGVDNLLNMIYSDKDLQNRLMEDVYNNIINTSIMGVSTTEGADIVTDLGDSENVKTVD